MKAHGALSAFWNLLAAGSLIAFTAVVATGLVVGFGIVRFAYPARRWDILGRLAVPIFAAGLVLVWLVGASLWNSYHNSFWAPLPWSVSADLDVPPNRPSLDVP